MISPQPHFVDACVPMYAAGRAHPYKEPCLSILAALAEGKIQAVTDVEVIQEIVHRFRAIERQADGLRLASEFLGLMHTVLPVAREVAARFLALQQTYPFLPPRDALHVAAMVEAEVELIISADRHFDRVREVKRIDPADARW